MEQIASRRGGGGQRLAGDPRGRQQHGRDPRSRRGNGRRRRAAGREKLQGLLAETCEPDRIVGEQHQAQWRAAGRLGLHHRAVEPAGRQHRGRDEDRRSRFGPDQSPGPQCRHRGGAGRRSRSRLRGRGRRGAGAGRDVREKRPRRAKSGGPNSGTGQVGRLDDQGRRPTARRRRRKRARRSILALGRAAQGGRRAGRRQPVDRELGGLQAEAAAREAQKGAEIISSAAEEQAAAAAEALRSVEQQTAALEESQSATQSLAAMASDLGAAAEEATDAPNNWPPPRSSCRLRFRKFPARQARSWSRWSRSAGAGSSRRRRRRKPAPRWIRSKRRRERQGRTPRIRSIAPSGSERCSAEIRLTIDELSHGRARVVGNNARKPAA